VGGLAHAKGKELAHRCPSGCVCAQHPVPQRLLGSTTERRDVEVVPGFGRTGGEVVVGHAASVGVDRDRGYRVPRGAMSGHDHEPIEAALDGDGGAPRALRPQLNVAAMGPQARGCV
jgi:hypothetical protein